MNFSILRFIFTIWTVRCAMERVEKEKQDCLYRTYKKETGRSLAQYMLEKRMEKARKLLQGDMFVKNVALQTGYSNFSYFSKVFRDVEGMSPMEYRGKIRKR